MSIFLIGMPGVGKSTIGVILAKQLGYDFTDADLVIQKREKRRLPVILEEEGTEGFLRIEAEVCASLAGVRDTVVATGGSACYAADAMEAFRKNGDGSLPGGVAGDPEKKAPGPEGERRSFSGRADPGGYLEGEDPSL